MKAYKNVMELLVEDRIDEILKSLDCCKCEQCRSDIIAYALNQLPPKYVVTPSGEAYSKTFSLGVQHATDIATAITQGATIVSQNPRH